jgi:hypothetical protein
MRIFLHLPGFAGEVTTEWTHLIFMLLSPDRGRGWVRVAG